MTTAMQEKLKSTEISPFIGSKVHLSKDELLSGEFAAELRELRETVRRMLKENGPPPGGKWADIAFLEPVRDYKARHASTMLTFDAVVDAIGQIEAKTAQLSDAES